MRDCRRFQGWYLGIVIVGFGLCWGSAYGERLQGHLGTIEHVTINRANTGTVIRYIDAVLPAMTFGSGWTGSHHVVVNNLPLESLIANSIIITPAASENKNDDDVMIELQDIKLLTAQAAVDTSNTTSQLRDQIVALENSLAELQLEKPRIGDSIRVLDTYAATTMQRVQTDSVSPYANGSQTMLYFELQAQLNSRYSTRLKEIAHDITETTIQLRKAKHAHEHQIAASQDTSKQSNLEFGFRVRRSKDVAQTGLPLKFKMEYMVQNVSWEAMYDLNVVRSPVEANQSGGKFDVMLDYYSRVAQRTDEHWVDVLLHLSTATPVDLNTISRTIETVTTPQTVYFDGLQPLSIPKKEIPKSSVTYQSAFVQDAEEDEDEDYYDDDYDEETPVELEGVLAELEGGEQLAAAIPQSHVRTRSFRKIAGACDNTCIYARDGVCDDPRGANYCKLGTDCQDCGRVGVDNFTRADDDGWWDDHDDYWTFSDRDFLEQTKGIEHHRHTVKLAGNLLSGSISLSSTLLKTAATHSASAAAALKPQNDVSVSIANKVKASSKQYGRFSNVGSSNSSGTGNTNAMRTATLKAKASSQLTSVFQFDIPYAVSVNTSRKTHRKKTPASSRSSSTPISKSSSTVRRPQMQTSPEVATRDKKTAPRPKHKRASTGKKAPKKTRQPGVVSREERARPAAAAAAGAAVVQTGAVASPKIRRKRPQTCNLMHRIKVDRLQFSGHVVAYMDWSSTVEAPLYTQQLSSPQLGYQDAFQNEPAVWRLLSQWPTHWSTDLIASKDVQVFIAVSRSKLFWMTEI
jgi:hypothetical protein